MAKTCRRPGCGDPPGLMLGGYCSKRCWNADTDIDADSSFCLPTLFVVIPMALLRAAKQRWLG